MLLTASKRRRVCRVADVELPKHLDLRTVTARRLKALLSHYAEILGDEKPGAADASLILRCASQVVQLEAMDADRLSGKAIDNDLYVRICSELRRGEATLGRLVEA